VLDSHCVSDIFEKPWMGLVTGACSSFIILLPLGIVSLWTGWTMPPAHIVAMALLAGILIQCSQLLYFYALRNTEAGIIAAYWNLVPVLVALISFLLLKEVLVPLHYVGIAVLIGTSVAFCLLDSNLHARWNSLILMTIASAMQAVLILLEDRVYQVTPFLVGFGITTLGLILAGMVPVFFRHTRTQLKKNLAVLLPAATLILTIELINLLALFFSGRALDLGIPSLVSAVETTIPGYTFILSILLLTLLPRLGDGKAWRKLPLKLGLVGTMSIGVYFLA
jgi:drug/metabolite transporter (DMT)-like permease